MNASVYALSVLNSELYAGGAFDSIGNNPANRMAKWNGTTWTNLGTGTNNEVLTLALDTINNIIYAGGSLTTAGGNATLYIAKWAVGTTEIQDDIFNNEINIFPNPLISSTTIKLNKSNKNGEINIYNLYGQLVKTIKFSRQTN